MLIDWTNSVQLITCSDKDNSMNDLTQKLIVALVVIPTLFGVFQRPKEMAITVAAIALALAFANLEKFERFKGAGFEAEMRVAIDKTYAAIDDLKELAVSLSEPIVDSLTMSGQVFSYIPLSEKIDQIEKVSTALHKLGASEKEIDQVSSTLLTRVTGDHIKKTLYALRAANPEKVSLFAMIDDWKSKEWNSQKLNDFIVQNELKKDSEVEECLSDLSYFLSKRKLRRPDKWQS
jgi:hypothetical protein